MIEVIHTIVSTQHFLAFDVMVTVDWRTCWHCITGVYVGTWAALMLWCRGVRKQCSWAYNPLACLRCRCGPMLFTCSRTSRGRADGVALIFWHMIFGIGVLILREPHCWHKKCLVLCHCVPSSRIVYPREDSLRGLLCYLESFVSYLERRDVYSLL